MDNVNPALSYNSLTNQEEREVKVFDRVEELDQVEVGLSNFQTELKKVSKITSLKPKKEKEQTNASKIEEELKFVK